MSIEYPLNLKLRGLYLDTKKSPAPPLLLFDTNEVIFFTAYPNFLYKKPHTLKHTTISAAKV